jgi:hypothetical protein
MSWSSLIRLQDAQIGKVAEQYGAGQKFGLALLRIMQGARTPNKCSANRGKRQYAIDKEATLLVSGLPRREKQHAFADDPDNEVTAPWRPPMRTALTATAHPEIADANPGPAIRHQDLDRNRKKDQTRPGANLERN